MRARMGEGGLAGVARWGGKGGDPGAETTEKGIAIETRDRDSRRRASLQAGGAGADLTACEEARRGWPG